MLWFEGDLHGRQQEWLGRTARRDVWRSQAVCRGERYVSWLLWFLLHSFLFIVQISSFKCSLQLMITVDSQLIYVSFSSSYVTCTKRRHQSPEWMILSHIYCLIQRELIGFQVLWIVFIHIVRGRPGGLLQFSKGKLLRSSWHLFRDCNISLLSCKLNICSKN